MHRPPPRRSPSSLLVFALCCATIAIATSTLTLADSWGRETFLARRFPEFAKQKSQITALAVVVDVAEFEVEDNRATWVYTDDCRGLAQKLEDALVAALAAKGYPVKAQPVLSVGQGADTSQTCRVSSSWTKREQRPTDVEPVTPPFYADSTLSATADLVAAWRGVAQATLRAKAPKRGVPFVAPGAATVREALGADYAFVAIGLGTHNVRYQGVATGGRFGGMVSQADPSPYPGSSIQIALIDCRSGNVLWADGTSDWRAFSAARIDKIARDFVKQMP